jgi:hypothetical protein
MPAPSSIQQQRVVFAGIGKMNAGKTDADVRLRQLAAEYFLVALFIRWRFELFSGNRFWKDKLLARQVDQTIVIYRPCRGNDYVIGRVMASHETKQIAALQRPDYFGLAHDCLSERMRIPYCGRKVVMYDVAGSVKDVLDFLADNILLLLEFPAVEQRLCRDVCENIKALFEVLIEDARIEAGILAGRKSVQGAAKGLQRLGDLLGAGDDAFLETHVLDEMRDTILGAFLTAANVNRCRPKRILRSASFTYNAGRYRARCDDGDVN